MTDTQLSAIVWPQDDGTGVPDTQEDYPSAGYLGAMAHAPPGEQVTHGFGFTSVNTTANSATLTAGRAYIEDTATVQSGYESTYDTLLPNAMPYMVVLPANHAGLSLDEGENDVYLAVDPSANDSVYLRHGSAVSAPSDPAILLGTINTTTGEVTRASDSLGYRTQDQTPLTTVDVFITSDGSDTVATGITGEFARSTDAPAVFQAAIDACPTDGVINVSGSHDFDAQVTIGGGKTLEGTGTLTSSLSGDEIIRCAGTAGASNVSLTATASPRDVTLSVADASVVSAGDLLRLSATNEWQNTGQNTGELHRVDTVDTGTDTIYLTDSIEDVDGYTTGNSASFDAYTPESCTIRGLTFIGGGSESDYRCLDLEDTDGVLIEDVTIHEFGQHAIFNHYDYDTTIRGCDLSHNHLDGYGYGVNSAGSAHLLVTDCLMRDNRHGFASGGGECQSRNMLVESCRVSAETQTSGDTLIDAHPTARSLYVRDCIGHPMGLKSMVSSAARYTSVTGCVCHGGRMVNERDIPLNVELHIADCVSVGGGILDLAAIANGETFESITVTGCHVVDGWFLVRGGLNDQDPLVQNVTITGNTIENTDNEEAISLWTVGGGVISDNTIRNADRTGIRVETAADMVISGNRIVNPNTDNSSTADQDDGIHLGDVTDSVIAHNLITSPTSGMDSGIEESGSCDGNEYDGNKISGGDGTPLQLVGDAKVNGLWTASGAADTPTASNYQPGEMVDWTDTADASGDGVYLLAADGTTWVAMG